MGSWLTDDGVERLLREGRGAQIAAILVELYRTKRARGLPVGEAAEQTLLTLLDIQRGGSGDADRAAHGVLGRPSVGQIISRLRAEVAGPERSDDAASRVDAAIKYGIETIREIEILMIGLGWSPNSAKWGRVMGLEDPG